MGTKNNPQSQGDCYQNAEPDEPLFTLLARDKHAPTLVWLWSVLRELDGESPEIVKEAQQCVVDMATWAHDHGRKSAGLSQAALVAVLELVRVANYRAKQAAEEIEPSNEALTVAQFRAFMARTEFEKE